jgi:hypothetical protein
MKGLRRRLGIGACGTHIAANFFERWVAFACGLQPMEPDKKRLTVMKKNVFSAAVFAQVDPERRITFERRQFSYADCFPERRSGIDRRRIRLTVHQGGTIAGQSIKAKCGNCR